MKKNFIKMMLAFILVLSMGATLLVGCGKDEPEEVDEKVEQKEVTEKKEEPKEEEKKEEPKSKYTTLVLGSDDFNAVFNPFFATTGYDMEINERVFESLIKNDRLGAPISNLAEYVTPVEKKDADGNVVETVYTFKLLEGLTFSDGEPITADDIIFSYKVLCDPTYDGASTIFSTPILGVKEFRYDDENYEGAIAEIQAKVDGISDEAVQDFILRSCAADYEAYGADAVNNYTGFANPDGLEGEELKTASINAYYEIEKKALGYYTPLAKDEMFSGLEKEYIEGNLASGGNNVSDISGIKKIDDLTVQVTIKGVDPKAIWNLGGIDIAPEHYYGVDYKKGDLSGLKALNDKPMGSGAYTFEKFENNVVVLRANPLFFKGEPKIPSIKYQVVDTANRLEAVLLGEMDISDPTASPEMVQNVKDNGLHYELIENLGYGYIGVNRDRITDKNIRKGLMHLMNREPAVNTYYGELASVIQRPMSKVSWAYPKDATEYYGFNPDKALEYFVAAGYEQTTVDGKPFLAKDGQQLKYEIGISGDGIMDHPSAPILTQMKDEMEKLGAVLEINDCDGSILFERLDAGEWDMWVAAWGSTIDPDMYQVYHSKGTTNHYRVYNDDLDELIVAARMTNDVEARKEMYAEALNIIMDEAVEMPVYQRKNMYIFNQEIINIETLPEDMTPFYAYMREIQALELH